eukprot:4897661-Amphidinium_carterae.1
MDACTCCCGAAVRISRTLAMLLVRVHEMAFDAILGRMCPVLREVRSDSALVTNGFTRLRRLERSELYSPEA